MANSMILHRNARDVTRNDIGNVELPERTRSYVPIAHDKLLNEVIGAISYHNYRITGERHGLTSDGSRYFGVLEIANGFQDDEFCMSLGIRNSHDKRFPAGIVAGTRVFVCDNLSFSAEIQISRKHTRHILDDLPRLVGRAVARIGSYFARQENQVASYRDYNLTDDRARSLMVECVKRDALGCTHLPKVLECWENPPHDEFADKNVWRFFNAVTEVAKGWSADTLLKRTQILHGICDAEVGFATAV